MATVNYIRESKQTISAMKELINYCIQDSKVKDERSGRRLISGINCNGENAFNEFMTTKYAYKKLNVTNFYQYVQSFSPRENVTAEQVHKIGLEFAEKAWKGYEVLVTTHTDAEHLHNHFVINSVSFENGYKLRQNPSTLISLRNLSDRICLQHGLTVLKPYEKQGRKPSSREYRVAVKGDSWKQQLISNIYFAMNRSGNKDEFIKKMNEEGYQVTWTDERKYITFICPNGQKCRDIRLHDNKYLKGVLEQEFKIRSELIAKYYEGTLQENELSDEKFNTGWEKSRAVYFKLLDCSYQDSEQTNEAEAREYYQNYIQNQTPVGLGIKGIFELGNIIDSSGEDPEERRKRIEAEENASNLGALIGLTAGIISALVEDSSDELPEELEDEQNEISMNM